jgi:broad specificity phosphatase PhoE
MPLTFRQFIGVLPEIEAPNAIYVMRHGRTALDDIYRSDGWLDYPLSDQGRMRLITAQQYLKDVPIKRIYMPSLKRTRETAEIMQSGILNHPELIVSDNAKTWNLGTLMGTPKKPNKPIVTYFMTHPNEKPAGGESMFEFRMRFIPWLQERKAEALKGDGPILIVTSGSNLREISFQLTGDKNAFDLDEGGVMVMHPKGDEWNAAVVFGHKDTDNDWLS